MDCLFCKIAAGEIPLSEPGTSWSTDLSLAKYDRKSKTNSIAIAQPALSSIATLIDGATICPNPGMNLETSFAIVFKGCFNSVLFIVARAIFLATFSGILLPKTADKDIAIVVIVVISAAIPKPGTGIALPAAAATACEWIIV